MSRKAFVIVGLAAIIAASTGAALASNHGTVSIGSHTTETTLAAENSNEQSYSADNADTSSVITDDTLETVGGEAAAYEDTLQAETASIGESDKNNSASSQAFPTASYQIQRVVDRTADEEQSPRLLFGKYAGACYLNLYSDYSVEICLNPTAGTADAGTYTMAGDVMHVDFEGDISAEYRVFFSEDNDIEFIVVPYNDYDIYFG